MATILTPTPEHIALLAERLACGVLVAIPTETVYGLAADARSDEAVARIYAVKDRPGANPLIAHYPGLAAMTGDVVPDDRALRLADAFWPGPLTLVLPRRPGTQICERASAGLATLAVRCPDHPATRSLLAACGFPVVAPSANPSGRLSPVTAAHVQRWLGDRIDWILDGGPTRRGLESTIVDLSGRDAVLLRAGTITVERIEALIGPVHRYDGEAPAPRPRAPGTAFRHYAPSCPLFLDTAGPRQPGDALLAFGPGEPPAGFDRVLNLSPSGDLDVAAARLFDALHELEAVGAGRIFVVTIPNEGVGRAINDRLRRAAAATS